MLRLLLLKKMQDFNVHELFFLSSYTFRKFKPVWAEKLTHTERDRQTECFVDLNRKLFVLIRCKTNPKTWPVHNIYVFCCLYILTSCFCSPERLWTTEEVEPAGNPSVREISPLHIFVSGVHFHLLYQIYSQLEEDIFARVDGGKNAALSYNCNLYVCFWFPSLNATFWLTHKQQSAVIASGPFFTCL